MDERTFRLVLYSLGASVGVVGLDAALEEFVLPDGFWLVPSGILGLLTARATWGMRKNGDDGS